MAIQKVALASRWMSVTDIVDRLRRARQNREQQATLLDDLEERVAQHRASVERSLAYLSPNERSSVLHRTVNGRRGEVKRDSAEKRRAHLMEVSRISEEVANVRAHYQNPVQMLMREGLGSERRSRLTHQIEKSGPTELASLASLAASTNDRELAAALCGRIADLPRDQRSISVLELADALIGEEHRKVTQALMEIDRLGTEAVHADSAFETGQRNPTRSIQTALMRRQEQALDAPIADETEDQIQED